ncbi:MAG: hypothetical protein IPL96_09525 [Holophagaceae bacterium]|nr:hypothetical protein [Holophagaceae bacterium]
MNRKNLSRWALPALLAPALLIATLGCDKKPKEDQQVQTLAAKATEAQAIQQQIQTAAQTQAKAADAAKLPDAKPNPETMQLSPEQKSLLEKRLKEEKGTGTGDLLQVILDKDAEIAVLNKKLAGVRALLPRPELVKEGDNHYALAMRFLKKRGLDEEQAKELVAKSNILEELKPGWEVYHFFVNGKYGTSVSQGKADISPTDATKQAKQKLEGERDDAKKMAEELQQKVDGLIVTKTKIEADIDALRTEKTGLMEQVNGLSTLSTQQRAKLNAMHYLVGDRKKLEAEGVIVVPIFAKDRMGPNAKSARFDKDLALDGDAVITIKAAEMGFSKIGKVNVIPGSLVKDEHYSLTYSEDRSTATVKILDLERVRNDRVAFAISQ